MINKCVFPAAGYGTRFLPATKAMPKEMLPILTKPLIEYGVTEAMDAGCDTMAIITGRGKRAITDHFDTSYELEHQIEGTSKENLLKDIRNIIDKCTFTYTRQREMKGLGHAILTSKPLVGDEPFAVILADDLCYNKDKNILKQLIEVHDNHICKIVIAVQEVPMDEVHNYGIIDAEEFDDNLYEVNSLIEKPSKEEAPSNLAIIGRYILTPEIFKTLENIEPGKNNEIQITDAINEFTDLGNVIAVKFDGKRFDCGSIDGYVKATNYFYNLNK